jgi:hypothetical protein
MGNFILGVKKSVKKISNRFGFEIRRVKPSLSSVYSNLGEETIIRAYLSQLKLSNRFCVDMAAGDGVSMSNTYALFKEGWVGLAVELDSEKFSKLAYTYRPCKNVYLSKCKVTPLNVVELLRSYETPEDFAFLSLDLDGYDYFVLRSLLKAYRPRLLCVEINEKIPPPLKFTVKWNPGYEWSGDHFYGQSLSQLFVLCQLHHYALVRLHYNNAFLIPIEISSVRSLNPAEAYKNGYVDQPDRREKFPWNRDVDCALEMSPKEAYHFFRKYLEKYEGKYILKVK